MTNTVAVTAIGGAQQSAVAQAFVEQGWTVRGTTKTGEARDGIAAFAADLATGDGLDRAFDGVEVVAFTVPQDHRPGAMTRIAQTVAVEAARAGVGRLVVNLAATVDETSDTPLAVELRAVREAVKGSGVPFVLLEPTVFMDNLRAPWSLPAIVGEGVLAYPANEAANISWLSHRSLGEFMVAAASRSGVAGREFRIGGPDALAGPEVARLLAERIGRPVNYQRVPLEGFAAGMNQAMGAPAGDRVASLYARLDAETDAFAVDWAAHQSLAVEPETFAAFIDRQEWSLPPT